MNIFQSERIFEMQNEYLKHRTEIEVQNKEGGAQVTRGKGPEYTALKSAAF